MKKLYVQFFKHGASITPEEQYFVCVDNCGSRETQESIKLQAYNMSVWFTQYPHGRVNFVWI